MLGFVDIALELTRYGPLRTDERRRQIVSLSRHPRTPERLVYEWTEGGSFVAVEDARGTQFEQNWAVLRTILEGRRAAATHAELLADWPAGEERPAASVLYEWLKRAYGAGRVRRQGSGTRTDPWRYRLPTAADAYYDRGELPPLPDLPGLRRREM